MLNKPAAQGKVPALAQNNSFMHGSRVFFQEEIGMKAALQKVADKNNKRNEIQNNLLRQRFTKKIESKP